MRTRRIQRGAAGGIGESNMLAFLFGLVLGILLTLALLSVVIWLLLRGSNRASAAHVLVAAALALKGKQAVPNDDVKS
jgi:hypothetical protein